jgi:phosphocarrier protein HPr
MYTRRVTLDNATGLHVRPATAFMELASRYRCAIRVAKGDIVADGKSAISLMLLEAGRGTALTIEGDGDDETEAVDALVGLVARQFADAGIP